MFKNECHNRFSILFCTFKRTLKTNNMKRILVPTDFSQEAEFALKVAAQLAQKYGAEIYLLHLLDLPLHLATSQEGELPEAIFFMKLAHQRFEKFMDKPYLKGIAVHETVEADITHYGINAAVEKNKIDFIVMGSSGASGVKEMFIGSNTEKVVRTATVPVLIVKNDINHFTVQNMVYACDFEPESFNAYKRALQLANEFGAKVHLLFVNTPNNFITTQEAESNIQQFIAKHKPENYTLNIYNDITVEQGILHFSRAIKADAIAMSTHGRKGLAHFFNGSISEDLVNHAIRPVITFRI